MNTILGVSGSPRSGGNSDVLLQSVLEGAAGGGVGTEAVYLREHQFQGCIGCERCRKDETCTGLMDGMQALYPKIREAHGMVLVSPIYSYNVTALMKAFIDRLYAFYYFDQQRPGHWHSRLDNQGRKAALVVVGEQSTPEEGGADLTMAVLRRSVAALGYEVVAELPALGFFPKGKVREQPQVLEQAEAAGRLLASRLQAV